MLWTASDAQNQGGNRKQGATKQTNTCQPRWDTQQQWMTKVVCHCQMPVPKHPCRGCAERLFPLWKRTAAAMNWMFHVLHMSKPLSLFFNTKQRFEKYCFRQCWELDSTQFRKTRNISKLDLCPVTRGLWHLSCCYFLERGDKNCLMAPPLAFAVST